MKHQNRDPFLLTAFLFLLFAVFTAVVSFVDVRPIGPEQSSVGLASLNRFMFGLLGAQPFWYAVTELLGAVAVSFACGFAVLGLAQLFKRKSLWKVDVQLLLLGVFYATVAAAYFFFEAVVINYRPVILHSGPEASYPSSHVMAVLCIMATAMMQFRRLLANNKPWLPVLNGLSLLVMVTTVVGRLLSGVHWFTDIVGGVLLSAALVMLYYSAVRYFTGKHGGNEHRKHT